jgi:hypothetical protein
MSTKQPDTLPARWYMAELETANQRINALQSLNARFAQESRIHAQEARTANSTIAEIYQCVTGSTGEPGNWHGADPVRKHITELEMVIQSLRERLQEVGDAGFTAADMATAEARGFREGQAAELAAMRAGGEVACKQYQSRDGEWRNFIGPKHEADTIACGRWPIRSLYAHPQPAAQDAERIQALELEVRQLTEQLAELRKGLELAIKQNSHDMLMTGEELRECEAALAGTAPAPMPAARAPADSVTAPTAFHPAGPCVICGSDEPFTGTCGSGDQRALCKQPTPPAKASPAGAVLGPDALYEIVHGFGHTTHEQSMEIAVAVADLGTLAPVAQAADSVLEDAARYLFLRDGKWRDTDLEPVIRLQLNSLWDAKIDAARKQGGA